ncbi:dicarboxylate/amino acid:cation symporter [Proteiniclasticum sp. SCR006]|uniref:Dicarboxylate/amino acid:cation symporter n=1 Tax=Proteiniclasticum aestuarii TaxID=2817862 RepID=A0A939KL42_9CLOT|nr:dicarboxylate/amino acid:cation symporter [Proteiniclasticum aestuarii]MBO1265290.1 dicarboxylate/amino acid:cation symporter [Proteiniclasticum aestuarii]
MKKINFSLQIVIATVLAILSGLVFGEAMEKISFLGDIFLRLIQMSVVLLVMTAIIESVGAIEPGEFGKIGLKAIILFVITTVYSAVIGVFAVNMIKPGVGVIGVEPAAYQGEIFNIRIQDLITSFIPRNVFQSMAEGNMIQIIVFSIFFGMAVSLLRKKHKEPEIYRVVVSFGKVIMEIIKKIMLFAPVGIFALLSSITGSMGTAIIMPLLKYLFTMFFATFFIFTTFLILVSLYAKVNPFRLIMKMKDTIIVSVTTTSSAISLPVQMSDCEHKIGISSRISKLVNSLAMSLNSDGLALTLSISTITIAQFFGIELSLQQQIVIVAVSTLSTLGNLLVPGGALVAMAIALNMTGLPLEGIALIAGVDWFAGIARTLLNVINDVLCTFYIAVSEREFDREIFDKN